MAITQKEIAEKTGVSQALVATILGNRQNSRIRASEETRRRVLEYAQRHDYRPNTAARALQSGKTHTVACMYIRHIDYNLRAALAYINEILAQNLGAHGYTLAVKVFEDQAALRRSLLDICHARSADAVVLGGPHDAVLEQGEAIESLGLPFVVQGNFTLTHPEWLQVDFDQYRMMQTCVRFLADRGNRKIAYIGFEFNAPFVLEQIAGYKDAMRELLGSEPPAGYVGRWETTRNVASLIDTWFDLPLAEQPTAYVIGSNNAWSEVERALARRGLRIGYGAGDIAATGVASLPSALMAGHGHVFAVTEDGVPDGWFQTGTAMANKLLIPLLKGEKIASPVYRIMPELVETVPHPDRFFSSLFDQFIQAQPLLPTPPK